MTHQEVLQASTIEGNHLRLPSYQLERSLYQQVAKALNLIGGKWTGGKIAAFVFPQDPAPLVQTIINGRQVNLQKEYQFFATPAIWAGRLVELADIEEYDMILEPSAGQGAIIKAIQAKHNNLVHYCELMELNRGILAGIPNTKPLTDNFLTFARSASFHGMFHKILANPPYSKNQDIIHIKAMHRLLAEGGKLVSFASKHWQFASGKKEADFRKWLNDLDHDVIEVPAGEFKESGTMIPTCIIVIHN